LNFHWLEFPLALPSLARLALGLPAAGYLRPGPPGAHGERLTAYTRELRIGSFFKMPLRESRLSVMCHTRPRRRPRSDDLRLRGGTRATAPSAWRADQGGPREIAESDRETMEQTAEIRA